MAAHFPGGHLTGPSETEFAVIIAAAYAEEPVTACCARCRRGTAALGDFGCGYHGECPNPNCNHARRN